MDFLILHHVAMLVIAAAFTFYLVPFFTQTAFKLGVLDVPDGTLKKHKKPVPYMGGIAIYLAFLGTIGLLYPIEERVMWLLTGATMLMFVGFIDDLKRIRPSRKLLGQFLGVACFLHGGLMIKQSFFTSIGSVLLTGFWMLSLINAVNLIDIMDGLATSVAIVAASGFCIAALLAGQYGVSLLLLAFIGALLGFFWYNKPAAKIYMGDAGSLFIGGFLAAVPLLIKWSAIRYGALYVALIIPAIPLVEVACLVVIRTWKGIPFYMGSPHHFAIYLQNKGWSRWWIITFSVAAGIYLNLFSILFLQQIIGAAGLIAAGIIFCACWYGAVFSALFIYPGSKFAAARVVKKEDSISESSSVESKN